jgi:hypothetical protein
MARPHLNVGHGEIQVHAVLGQLKHLRGINSRAATRAAVAPPRRVRGSPWHFGPPPPRASRVSFDQFGQWCNAQGYLVLPCLELLDLTK